MGFVIPVKIQKTGIKKYVRNHIVVLTELVQKIFHIMKNQVFQNYRHLHQINQSLEDVNNVRQSF